MQDRLTDRENLLIAIKYKNERKEYDRIACCPGLPAFIAVQKMGAYGVRSNKPIEARQRI